LVLRVIGVVRSGRANRADTPVQAALNRAEEAVLEVDPLYAEALDGLSGFDFAWLISWLGERGAPGPTPALRQVPFLLRREPREIGVFATRGPRRVNPLGLSLVQVVEVDGNRVRFAGVDLVDGTPIVDIKPYVSRFDRPDRDVRCGWLDGVEVPDGATPSSLDAAGPDSRPG
jgi:tRNA-Thr(GGU) m(6)t(6)A37 methyltransferase TsaA